MNEKEQRWKFDIYSCWTPFQDPILHLVLCKKKKVIVT
jgi:hypothetical protein